MFHACVQRFDGMDEKKFSGELNRALQGLFRKDLIQFLNPTFLLAAIERTQQ